MSETTILIFGCFVFGLALAASMIVVISTSEKPIERPDPRSSPQA